jgi:hypothetical protein
MATTAATMVLPRVPGRLSPPFSSPNLHNLPLHEVNLHPSSSPLMEITNNFSSSENRSSSTENRSESIPVSTTNARYQAASEGAYLSVPETIGLRTINCLNEEAHHMGYDSDEVQWDDYAKQPLQSH